MKNIMFPILKHTVFFTVFVNFLLLLVPFSFAKGLTEQSEITRISLLLDWTPNTNHVGAYVAMYNGYFETEKIIVNIPPVADTSVETLVGSNKAEFGFSYQENVTFARASTTPIPVVAVAAVLAHNTSGFAAPADRNIQSPIDFRGKTYGSYGSPIEEAMLNTVMKQYGITSNTVKIVQTGMLDFFQGTKSGVFDFSWIFEGWTGVEAQLKNEELYYLALKDINITFDYYTPVIISSEQYIKNNPTIAKAFMQALSKGYTWAQENPIDAANILLFYAPELEPDLVRKSMRYLAPYFTDTDPANNIGNESKWGVMKDEVWTRYTSWLKSNGFISVGFSLDGTYTNSLLITEE